MRRNAMAEIVGWYVPTDPQIQPASFKENPFLDKGLALFGPAVEAFDPRISVTWRRKGVWGPLAFYFLTPPHAFRAAFRGACHHGPPPEVCVQPSADRTPRR